MTPGPDATWTYDASHYPEPLSPLSADVWLWALGLGIREAARALRAPFGGFETRTWGGGWAYEHELRPDWEPNPAQLERAALDVGERWEAQYRPRVEEITEEIRALRPERGDAAEAAAELDRLLELVREQWRIHFLVVLPVHAAREVLHDAYVARFGKRDELEPYRLLEGLPNATLDADLELWHIAELARRRDVADLILGRTADEALERLRALQHGREVLAALDGYLLRYGGRVRLHELSEPRDVERPGRALESVRLFLERSRDLPGELRARAEERERLQLETLERIDDPADRAAFADLLARVVRAAPLEETHAYAIDYPGLCATREALLGFGRRLASAGLLEAPEDAFMLRRDELREGVSSGGERLRELVSQRRRELAAARQAAPPAHLGPAPGSSIDVPPVLAKFYGVPGSARQEGAVLHGTGASAGKAAGTARIVLGHEDFARVAAGDILVCPTTTPAWTALFASIGGLVTDTGGILSHAAVVAREYRLPAVVGTELGTRAIPDGARVELDGEAGEVRILDAPE